jgi:hypothetical protein
LCDVDNELIFKFGFQPKAQLMLYGTLSRLTGKLDVQANGPRVEKVPARKLLHLARRIMAAQTPPHNPDQVASAPSRRDSGIPGTRY